MRNSLKKTLFYGSLFALLIAVNTSLVYTMRLKARIRQQTDVIFAEIGDYAYTAANQRKTAPLVLGEFTAQINEIADSRVANLKAFFRHYNSPLYDNAETIVAVSDQYGFDYRLLPAIAMQESNLCKYIPEGSYNCWGWGIYGSLITKFDSYDDGIKTVAEGLKTEYLDKGLVRASDIMQKYTPSSKGSWAHGVNTFLKALQ